MILSVKPDRNSDRVLFVAEGVEISNLDLINDIDKIVNLVKIFNINSSLEPESD